MEWINFDIGLVAPDWYTCKFVNEQNLEKPKEENMNAFRDQCMPFCKADFDKVSATEQPNSSNNFKGMDPDCKKVCRSMKAPASFDWCVE